jgi:hypothetical protein
MRRERSWRAAETRSKLVAKPSSQWPEFRHSAYALALIDRIEEGFSNPKHRQQWRNTLQTYCQPIWTLPIDRVDPAGVLASLTPIWRSKPETASRLPICSGQRLDDVSGAKAGPDESVACTTSSCAGFHAPPSVARFLAYRSRDTR